MRYFIIAGEASGDLHGSGLVSALKLADPDAQIRGWGGDKMQQAGADILMHYRELAFMGFVEVAMNIGVILRNFKTAKKQIIEFKPDALILIDYPGFNLRMAKWAADRNLKVIYYISPQLWAWKENRVEIVREFVDRMFVILPFEKTWYSERGIEVEYVGHPLLEAIKRYRDSDEVKVKADDRTVALLPGSRKQEIAHMLPVMLQVALRRPEYHFVVAKAPHLPRELYEAYLAKSDASNVSIAEGNSYDCLSSAVAAITTSGTATLETALFNVPQVVCYKGSALSFAIARRLVKVPFISLVNLIAGKPVVEELIQDNVKAERMTESLDLVLAGDTRDYILNEYKALNNRLNEGGASKITAASIVAMLKSAD